MKRKRPDDVKARKELFLDKAYSIHGDRYDYSNVDYVNSNTNVIIICKDHREFLQMPQEHQKGSGCPKCAKTKKKTTEEFIAAAKKVHGSLYDYSLVDYVNNITDVIIICRDHREFLQPPKTHTRGQGCPTCGGTKKKTTEEFIDAAKKVHGSLYDYSLVDYVNNRTEVIITCGDHGGFPQVPYNHLSGFGCSKCSGKKKKTNEEFIADAKKVHGNLYDYARVDYVNSTTGIIIVCEVHGPFSQSPDAHLSGSGCPDCGGSKKKTREEFIAAAQKVHGNLYSYDQSKYVNSKTLIDIICGIHAVFQQTPLCHIHLGQGCPTCAGNIVKTKEEFIASAEKVHGKKYDYSLVNYINSKTKVCILCPRHHEFYQDPCHHVQRAQGCPSCKTSHMEVEMNKTLTFLHTQTTLIPRTWKITKINGQVQIGKFKLDHHVTLDNNQQIAIEMDGQQHFYAVDFFGGEAGLLKIQERDAKKNDVCRDQHIHLLRIDSTVSENDYEKIVIEFFNQVTSNASEWNFKTLGGHYDENKLQT